jgi:glycerol-3-phosphate dehydrogenase
MAAIARDPSGAARERFDLIVVGGGIQGAMLALAAVRRNKRPLLVEKEDFGWATTGNSLRILHGGFRYLQRLDIHRFRESVAERRWFMRRFPGLVVPLPCLMPLYGEGLRRPSVLRAALRLNDVLSRNGVRLSGADQDLPRGGVIDRDATRNIFPPAAAPGLRGGAVWYDALMPDPQRILMSVLRQACAGGAVALNYVEARFLLKAGRSEAAGIVAVDRESGRWDEFRAPVVINAAGPWCRSLARTFDRDEPSLFRRSIAWNVLLDRKTLCDHAVAVGPGAPGGRTYFLLPWKGRLLAGTGHAPANRLSMSPEPAEEQLEEFLEEINRAVPTLALRRGEVLRVYAGFLPVTEEGGTNLTVREIIVDHGDRGGSSGLYSVSGIKFTTARRVSEKTLDRIFPRPPARAEADPDEASLLPDWRGLFDFDWTPDGRSEDWTLPLRALVEEESVVHLDDLVLRRTSLGDNPLRAEAVAGRLCDLFPWDGARRAREIGRLLARLDAWRDRHDFRNL